MWRASKRQLHTRRKVEIWPDDVADILGALHACGGLVLRQSFQQSLPTIPHGGTHLCKTLITTNMTDACNACLYKGGNYLACVPRSFGLPLAPLFVRFVHTHITFYIFCNKLNKNITFLRDKIYKNTALIPKHEFQNNNAWFARVLFLPTVCIWGVPDHISLSNWVYEATTEEEVPEGVYLLFFWANESMTAGNGFSCTVPYL